MSSFLNISSLKTLLLFVPAGPVCLCVEVAASKFIGFISEAASMRNRFFDTDAFVKS
jgi:hypothetical protein